MRGGSSRCSSLYSKTLSRAAAVNKMRLMSEAKALFILKPFLICDKNKKNWSDPLMWPWRVSPSLKTDLFVVQDVKSETFHPPWAQIKCVESDILHYNLAIKSQTECEMCFSLWLRGINIATRLNGRLECPIARSNEGLWNKQQEQQDNRTPLTSI